MGPDGHAKGPFGANVGGIDSAKSGSPSIIHSLIHSPLVHVSALLGQACSCEQTQAPALVEPLGGQGRDRWGLHIRVNVLHPVELCTRGGWMLRHVNFTSIEK